jgi:citrate synthase
LGADASAEKINVFVMVFVTLDEHEINQSVFAEAVLL